MECAFEYSGIAKIVIPATVGVIGKWAFRFWGSLSDDSFEPGSRLQRIGKEAFREIGEEGEECKQLTIHYKTAVT
jgi:hypothetical protein